MRSQYYRADRQPSECRNVTEEYKREVDAFLRLPVSEQIRTLAAQGKAYREIAKRTGSDITTIMNLLSANDVFQDDIDAENEIDDELEYQLREEHFDKIPDHFTHVGIGA